MNPSGETTTRGAETALFPLNTVLFPGGLLPLRIFEARYVDMVRSCMRDAQPFGVVPISHGSEVGDTPQFQATGTLATIESWDQGNDGLLHISARGSDVFRIVSHRVEGDGLVVGAIELCPAQTVAVSDEYVYLRELLEQVFAAHAELAPPQPWAMDDAGWLAYRLSELLPLDVAGRVAVLELLDPAARLAHIARFIETRNPSADTGTSH